MNLPFQKEVLNGLSHPFDPMEKAIINIGDQFLQNSEHIHADWVMEKEYPVMKKQ